MSNASQIHPHPITEGDESLGESSQTRSKMEGSTSTRCSANDALDSFVPDALYNANGLKLVDFGSSKAKRKGGHGVRKRQQSYSFSVAQGNEVLTSKDTQVDIYPEKIKVLVNFLTNNNQILRDLRHPEHDNRVSEFQNVCARTVCDLPDTSVIKDVLHGFGWDSKSNKFKVNAETGSSSEDMLVSTLYSSLSQSLSTLYLTHLNRKRKEDLFSRIKGKTLEELDGPAVTDDKEAPWDEDATGEENNELLSDAALGNSFCPNILFHHLYEALYHRRVHQASRVNGSVYRRRRASNAPDRDNGCVTPPNGEIPSAYSNENSATPPYSILEMGVEEGSGSRGTQPKPKRQNSETPMIQSHLKATSTLFPGACVLADISGFTKLSCKYCLDGVDGLDRLHDTVSHFLGRFVQIVYAHRGDVISFAGDALICVFTSILAVDATKEEHEKDYCCRAIHCAHALRNHYTDQLTSHIGVSCGNMSFANLGGYKQSWVYMVNGACIPELSQCIDDASSKQVVVTSAVFANITRGLLPDETVQAVRLPSGNYRVDSMSTATTPPPTHSRFYYVKEINRITEYSKRFVPRPALDSINSGTFHLLSELREVTTMFLKLDTYNPENNRDPLTLQEFFYMAQIALHNTGGFMRQFLIDDKGCVLIGMWGVPSCSFPQNASRALNCAMSIRAGTHKLNHKCSIGITTGNVFCGNIGSLVRRDFVGIGHTVNLAARLMGKSKGSIFIDEETYSYLPVDFRNQLRASERFQVKGVSEPIIAYICDQNIDLNFLDVTKSGQAKKSYLPMKIAEALRKHIEIMKNSLNQDRVSMMVNNAPTMMELQNIMSTQCKSNVYITIIEGVQGSGKSAGALYYKSLAKKSGLKVCQFRAKDVDENTSYGVIRRLFLSLLGEKVFQAGIEAQKQLLTALVVNIPWDKILPGENGNSMSAPRGDQSHSSASYCDPAILVEFRKAKEYSEHEQVCALALALGLLSLLGQLEAEEVVHENEGTIHSERTPGSTASKPPMSAATVECLMALSLQHLIKKIAHCVAIEDMNYCDAASWRCIYILLQTPLHAIFLFTTRNFRGRTGKDKRISNVGMSCMCNSKKAALNAVENNDDHNSSTSVTEDYHVRQSDRNKAKIETYCKIINHSNTILLEMAPLKFKEVKKLVEQSLRKHQIILSSATVQLILEISSGNVFWCQEIANFIMERGLEEFEAKIDAGVTDDEKTVTNPLQVLVICRLEKLTTEQQVALRHAALIDLEFSLLLLIAILPPKLAANIDSIMKALVNASFIELSPDDSDMFIFSNANIRQILCYLTPPRVASGIHRAIAAQLQVFHLENLKPVYARLSYHLLNGGDEVRDEAFKYTVKSADDCLSRGVYGDAYEKCVCAYETAQTISEYGVLEKLVTKAISDLNRKHGQFSVVTKKINEISRHRTEQTSVSRSNTNATASAITLENEQEHYASLLKDIEVSLACLKKMQKDPTVPLIKGVSIRNTSSKKQEVKLLGRTSVKWKMSYTDSSPKTSLGPNFSLGGLGSYHRGSIVHKVASQFIRFDDGGGQQSKDSFKMDPSHISLVEEETVDVESKPVVQKEQAQSCIIS